MSRTPIGVHPTEIVIAIRRSAAQAAARRVRRPIARWNPRIISTRPWVCSVRIRPGPSVRTRAAVGGTNMSQASGETSFSIPKSTKTMPSPIRRINAARSVDRSRGIEASLRRSISPRVSARILADPLRIGPRDAAL
jgi:hypothetical protein